MIKQYPTLNRRIFMINLGFIYISAATAPMILPENASAEPPPDFLTFWSDFRRAVEGGDKARIVALTSFPFRIRGDLDSDPVRKVSKAEFSKTLDQILDSEIMLSINISKTMRQYIIAHVTPAANEANANNAHIGHFYFTKTKGQWLFTMATTGETN